MTIQPGPLLTHLLVASAVWIAAFGAVPATAAEAPRAVIELFTSQGCSSCPPADAVLAEVARRPEVIALTLPVDYWDYLGWKDTLAQPAFTARQRAYAHLRGDRRVYTPQIVVNGTRPFVGSDRAQLDEILAGGSGNPAALPIAVTLAEREDTVVVEVNGAREHQATGVWILPVRKSQTIEIGRGENSGRKITYVNIVRGLVRIGEWRGGKERFEVSSSAARGDGDGYVVLLQGAVRSKPGVILGGAKSAGL